MEIAHIINPVVVPNSSDLHYAQPITFRTLGIAKEFTKGRLDVQIFSTQFPEDRGIVPDFLSSAGDLDRSVIDLQTFRIKRRLPLLRDILDRLYQVSQAEYLVYTNVDIAVLPYFYVTVADLISSGYDAFVINRRTIPDIYTSISEIPRMYAEIGKHHPGYDCFVYPRVLYPKFFLGDVCVGMNWIGKVLLWNLACFAGNFREIKDLHLTFHIGNEKRWKMEEFDDYNEHNQQEAKRIFERLNAENPAWCDGFENEAWYPNFARPESDNVLTRVRRNLSALKNVVSG